MFLDKMIALVSGTTPKADAPSTAAPTTTPAAPPPVAAPATDTLDAALAPVTPSTAPALSTLDLAVSKPTSHADLIEIKVNGLDEAKKYATWLTKGQDRTQPATAVRLVDCTSDHLKNIVANKPNLSGDYLRVIEAILADRGETLPDDGTDDNTDYTL